MFHWTRSAWPFLILAVCGCSVAVPQVQSGNAAVAYSTGKGPQLFAKCLEGKFGALQAIRFGTRAAISSKSGLEIDVFDDGTVRVRRPMPLDEDTRRRLEACL